MRAIARLAAAWLLLFVGAVLMLDASTPLKPRGKFLTALEVTGGFALLIVGAWLRRLASRNSGDR